MERLEYEAQASRDDATEWVVEAINYDGDGEIYVARFSGPIARERAEEYAAWKNGGGGADVREVARLAANA